MMIHENGGDDDENCGAHDGHDKKYMSMLVSHKGSFYYLKTSRRVHKHPSCVCLRQ